MESSEHILSVAVPKPIDGLFTYRLPAHLVADIQVGGWVKVPFRNSLIHAFVVEPPKLLSEMPKGLSIDSLKFVAEVGEPRIIFSNEVLALCKWAHDYYKSPLGEVLHCAAPPAALGLKSSAKRKARPLELSQNLLEPNQFKLTPEQIQALQELEVLRCSTPVGSKPKVALLHGVTGSGKTELYLELARRTLKDGKGVLLLVPEIALTPQLHERFEAGLGAPVGLWHSALADGKRRDQWAALQKGELRVVVGARSAVFAPVPDLGLIVIDEEHDASYKQEDRVKYHARDLAVVRSKMTGATLVLGSATPSLETRERVREGKYSIAKLTQRVLSNDIPRPLPQIEIINLCEEERCEKLQAPLAVKTLQEIQKTIAAGQQVMVFLNRRGFAAFLVCEECGEVCGCPNCSISLTVHKKPAELRCHVCGHKDAIPTSCKKCKGVFLSPVGAGTESLEEELPKLIEGAVALRLDRDMVTSTTRLEAILDEFRSGKANLLLGTQMLAKGHDFPGVTLVVVILADGLFRWPDFRAPERSFQLLTQVAGRAGRGETPGKVLIQTFSIDHPVIRAVQGTLPEDEFLETEREMRKVLGYPPFGRLAKLRFEDRSKDDARIRAMAVVEALNPYQTAGKIDLLGPSEAFLERAKGIFRWDLLIKTPNISDLERAVLTAREVCQRNKWQVLVDIDPYGVN